MDKKVIKINEAQIREMVSESVNRLLKESLNRIQLENIIGKFLQNHYPKDRFKRIFISNTLNNKHHSVWMAKTDYDDNYEFKNDKEYLNFIAEKDWEPDSNGYGRPISLFLYDLEWDDDDFKKVTKMQGQELLNYFEKWLIDWCKTDMWES